jgi:putative peptidoglycan lipid II flippase
MNESLGQRVARDTTRVSAVNCLAQIAVSVTALYVAATFGADWRTDAFYLALTIPMFAAGAVREAIRSILVPMLVGLRLKAQAAVPSLATTGLVVVGAGATALMLLLGLAMPAVTALTAGHLTTDGQSLTLALSLALLSMLPSLCVAATLASVFNASGRFLWPAGLPGLDALVKLLAVALLGSSLGIHSLALGSVLGPLLGVAVLGVAAHRLRMLGSVRPRWPDLRRMGTIALFPMLGVSLLQLNPFIDRYMATALAPGSVTALTYAERIVALPYLLVGAGYYGVLLAHWSEVAAAEGVRGVRRALRDATAAVVYALAPVATLLVVLGEDVVRLLLERGAFGPQATALTASTLGHLALGIVSSYVALLVSRAFLALGDTATPTWLGIGNALLNVALNLVLIGPLGLAGIALSTTLTWTVAAVVGWLLLHRRLGSLETPHLARPLAAVVLGSLACAGLASVARSLVLDGGGPTLLIRVVAPGAAGLAAYAAVTWALRVEEAVKLRVLLPGRWR